MDRKVHYETSNERNADVRASEAVKKAFEKSIWRQRVENYRKKPFKQLSTRHQHLIENYINSQLGCQNDESDDDVLVNEIKNGKISFAFEGMEKFPRSLVEVLRNDITHLDLSMNNIRNFEFLRGFKNLKSLIVDENTRMEINSFPPIDTLELFYANKCDVEFPRSFIFHVSVIFPHLKYFSMMTNPVTKRACLEHIWKGRDHRMRMFSIFIIPSLIHYNDKEVTEEDRQHSAAYHKYLGPTDCNLSKFKTLPDTDDIRKILPVYIRDKTSDMLAMEFQDNEDHLEQSLAAVRISAYFESQQDDSVSSASFISSDKNSSSSRNSPNGSIYTTDEGIGFMASEQFFD